MAHVAIARFYHEALRPNHARPSTLEWIASAPSVFAVEAALDDFRRFAREASPKVRKRVLEAAYMRRCELCGVLP
jgi:hypothetical protein